MPACPRKIAMPGLDLVQVAFLPALAAAGFSALAIRSRLLRFPGELYTVSASPSSELPVQFFQSLHGLLRPRWRRFLQGQPWVSIELLGQNSGAHFRIWIPRGERPFIESILRASYPGVELTPVTETPFAQGTAIASVRLARGNFRPLRRDFDQEPLSSLFWTLARPQGSESIALQLLVKPKTSGWQVLARIVAQALRDGRRGLGQLLLGVSPAAPASQFERDQAQAIEEKARELGFDCVFRVVAAADDKEKAREFLRATAASFRPFTAANSFDFGAVFFERQFREDFAARYFGLAPSILLTAQELAGLWHLPAEALPQVSVVRSPKLPPPPGASEGDRLVGFSTWPDSQPVRLSVEDSRHHLHLLGATGTGKTTAMVNLAAQDIAAGRGVGVLDPKGDLIERLIPRIPRDRLKDVVLISPHESDLTVGINPLEVGAGEDRDLVAENTLTIFKRIYERYWGMRTDDILKSALLTLLRQPNATLAHIPLLLTDPDFRRRVVSDLNDPIGLDHFWAWYEKLSDAGRGEAIGPVLNKLRDFLVRPRLRRLLCQPRSTVDLRKMIDSRQILLADLSVGRWGETTAGLIGSFLVAKLWQAALARAAIPEEERSDFFLFIDEFQHFLGIAGPFADALAQARSLRLSLTIANQHLGQLPRDLREAINSNARSRAVFQCGQDDASYLAREFAPLDATALMSLPRFEMAARLSIRGETSRPFTLRTLPSTEFPDRNYAAEVRDASLAKYGRHVAVVDRELQATLAPMEEPKLPGFGVGRRPRR